MEILDKIRTEELITEVKRRLDTKQPLEFVGTTEEWDALSLAEKTRYTIANVTDGDETGVNKVGADGSLSRIAGRGSVEYGASTVRSGTVNIPSLSNGYTAVNVTFDKPMPDADYVVEFTRKSPWNESVTLDVIDTNTNGFKFAIMYNGVGAYANTSTVAYTAFKLHTVEGLEELENNKITKSVSRYSSAEELLSMLQNQGTQTQFDFAIGGTALSVGGATFPIWTTWHMYKDTSGSACFGGVGYSYNAPNLYHVYGGWNVSTGEVNLTITQK